MPKINPCVSNKNPAFVTNIDPMQPIEDTVKPNSRVLGVPNLSSTQKARGASNIGQAVANDPMKSVQFTINKVINNFNSYQILLNYLTLPY